MALRTDWADTPDDFPSNTIPIGVYKLTVSKCEQKDSKAGNPMLVISPQVDAGEFEGRYVKDDFLLFGPSTKLAPAVRRKRALQRLGFTEKDAEIEAQHLVGRSFWGLVIHERYNDETQARLDFRKGYMTEAEAKVAAKDVPDIVQRFAAEEAKRTAPIADADCPF